MNEQAIIDAYNLFVKDGYAKSIDDFKKLIASNPEALNDSYNLFKQDGYNRSVDDFKVLMGIGVQAPVEEVKKKEPSTASVSGVGSSVSRAPKPNEPIDMRMSPYGQEARGELATMYAAPLKKEVKTEQQLAARQQKIEQATPKFAKEQLESITPELIGKEEQVVVPQLKYQFEPLGFKFDEAGATGDWMNVTSPTGEKIQISLDPFTNKTEKSEADKLKNFLQYHISKTPADKLAVVESQYQNENKKYRNEKEYADSLSAFNNEATALQKEMQDYYEQTVKFKYVVPTEEQKAELETKRQELIKKQEDIEGKQKSLEKTVGKYVDMKSQQGAWYDVLLKGPLIGTAQIFTGAIRNLANVVEEFKDPLAERSKSEMDNRLVKKEAIEIAKKYGATPPEYFNIWNVDNKKFDDWWSSLPDSVKGDVKDEMQDRRKKSLLLGKEINPVDTNIKFLENFVQGDSFSKEYSQDIQKGFWGGALVGVLQSLPAFIGGSTADRTARMFLQQQSALLDEMDNNPNFKDVSENEKMAVTLPIAVGAAALEEIGLRNIVSNKGVFNRLILRAMGKAGATTTAKTFGELVKNEVKSAIGRGALTATGAALAEFETGATQQALEIGVKDVYNNMQNKEMFITPDSFKDFASDVLVSGAQEAVGGLVLGMPHAVSAAYRKEGFKGMDNLTFQLFEAASKDQTIENSFVTDLKNKINAGKLTTEQAKEILNDYRNARGLFQSVPEDLSLEAKKEAMNLLREKRGLEEQTKGKDPALVKRQANRIAEINNELTKISENAVQEQATVESVLRTAEPQVGLPKVGEGNKELEVTTTGTEAITPALTQEKIETPKLLEDVESTTKALQSTDLVIPLRQSALINPSERQSYTKGKETYNVGDVIDGDKLDELSGGLVGNEPDKKFILVQAPLSKFKEDRETLLKEYEEYERNDEVNRLEGIKNNFDQTPPIPMKGDGLHRIVAAKELGKETILMWQEVSPESVSESYHKAKADGSNPELVKAVEDLLGAKPVAEAKPTIKSRVEYGTPIGNERGIQDIETSVARDERKKAVINAAKTVSKLFKSLFPNAEIYLFETQEDYTSHIKSLGDKRDSIGMFSYFTYPDGSVDARINIDLSRANAATVYHEIAHAVLLKTFGENKAKFKDFKNQLTKVLKESTVKQLNDFANRYEGEVTHEEWLVELAAQMVAQEKSIKLDTITKIAAIVNKIVSELTNGLVKPFSETASKKEVIDFFNQMAASIKAGKEIPSIGQAELKGISSVIKQSKEINKDLEKIPGYNKMLNDIVDTLIPNALKRKISTEEMHDMIMNFVQKNKVYKQANDIQKEQMFRDVRAMFGIKEKAAPSTAKVLGEEKTKVTVNEMAALKDQIRLEAKAAKNAIGAWNKASKLIANTVNSFVDGGKITAKQAGSIIKAFSKVNPLSKRSVDSFFAKAVNIMTDAEYTNKLSEAKGLRSKLSALSKDKERNGNLREVATQFVKIDPSMMEPAALDEYNKKAALLKESLKGSSIRKGNVKFSEMANIVEFGGYTKQVLDEQQKMKRQQALDELQELMGVDMSDLSYEDMLALLDDTETPLSDYNEGVVRSTINKAFNIYSTLIKSSIKEGVDPITGEKVEYTSREKEIIQRFMDMDLSLLSPKEALRAVDALNNFLQNKSTAGMEGTINDYIGESNAIKVKDAGVKAQQLKKYWIPSLQRLIGEQGTTIPTLMERMFKGFNKAGLVEKMMGLRKLFTDKSTAEKESYNITKKYVDSFYKREANGEAFNTAYNNIERGMAAYMMRSIIGNEQEMQKDFARRRGLVEQSIDALSNGNAQEKELAKLYQKAYDKIVKNANSIDDIKNNVDPTNLEAINYWIDEWASKYDEMADVSLNVHNKVLDKELNYVPDRNRRLSSDTGTVDLKNSDSQFHSNNGTVYKKKAGSLTEATHPDKLPTNDKKKTTSFIDLNFDNVNTNAMYDALMDTKTAATLRQVDSFMKSAAFDSIFPEAADAKLFKKRIEFYTQAFRKKHPYSSDEYSSMAKRLGRIATFGVGQALGGISQIPKQTIPIAGNTFVNTGDFDLEMLTNKALNKWLNESGYAIGNRGIESQTDVASIEKLINTAAQSKGEKLIRGLEKLNKIYLKMFLVAPDVFVARASWVTYYKKYLKDHKEQVPKGSDWETHKINDDAADYAQRMVDRQQNVSDADLAGKFFSDRESSKQMLVKMLMPFASFRMNQSTRLGSDLAVLTDPTATKEDKEIATRSLAGFAVEMALFRGISTAVNIALGSATLGILGIDEDDEEKKKRIANVYKAQRTAILPDILSPLPLLDPAIQMGGKLAEEGIEKAFNIKEEDNPLSIYPYKEKDFIASMGLYGIPFQRAAQLAEIAKLGATGKYTDNYGREKAISQKNKNAMKFLFPIALATDLVALPSEVNTMVTNAVKFSKKEGTKEEDGTFEKEQAKEQRAAEREKNKEEKLDALRTLLKKETDADVKEAIIEKINEVSADKEEKKVIAEENKIEKAQKKSLLEGYDTEEDLKRYDRDTWEKNFGENSDWYKEHQDENKVNTLMNKEIRAQEDIEQRYTPPKKGGFGSAKFGGGFSKKKFGSAFNSDGSRKKQY